MRTRVCFPFSALTQIQATLKNLKTIIQGRRSKVQTVLDITVLCLTERQSDEDEFRGGERGERGREVLGMRYRARRGEIETNRSSTRLPA